MFIFALGLAWSENAIQYDIIIWQPKLRQPPIRLKARTDTIIVEISLTHLQCTIE